MNNEREKNKMEESGEEDRGFFDKNNSTDSVVENSNGKNEIDDKNEELFKSQRRDESTFQKDDGDPSTSSQWANNGNPEQR